MNREISAYMQSLSIEDLFEENLYNQSFGLLNESLKNLSQMSFLSSSRKLIVEKDIYQRVYREFIDLRNCESNRLQRVTFRECSPNESFCEYFEEESNSIVKLDWFLYFFAQSALEIPAKQFFNDEKAHFLILDLLSLETKAEIFLAGFQFLINLSDHPSVRKDLKEQEPRIESLQNEGELTEDFKRELIECINWKPW